MTRAQIPLTYFQLAFFIFILRTFVQEEPVAELSR